MPTIMLPITQEIKELYFGEDTENWIVIDDTDDWIDEGKYSYQSIIVSPKSDPNLFYQIDRWKSGSYFTDYYWSIDDLKELELHQVEKVTKTIIVTNWERV